MGRNSRLNVLNIDRAAGIKPEPRAVEARDRLNRVVKVGDLVAPMQGGVQFAQVVDITPQMDPTGPNGVIVTAVAQFKWLAPRRGPSMGFVVVQPGEEAPEEPELVTPEAN